MITKDLGLVTAYAYAVSGGYTGTEAEFTELLGNIAKDLEEIEDLSVTVETLPPGSGATASYADGVLHLGIPRGDKGEKGDKGDKGDKGETGETGPQGPKGDPGDVSTEQLDEAISDVRTEMEESYARNDGYYEEMTVGDAEQLISTQFVEDSEPYLFRPTGGSADVGNREHLDSIVGGTVAWNQLYNYPSQTTGAGITFTFEDGVITLSGTATASYYNYFSQRITGGHKILVSSRVINNPDNLNFYFGSLNGQGRTQIGHSTITIASDLSFASGIGIESFGGVGTVFNNVKFKCICVDLTQMFNPTIADYIYSLEQATAGAGVAWFKNYFPKDYYPYDPGTLRSVEGVSAHETVGKNLADMVSDGKTPSISTGALVSYAQSTHSKMIKVSPSTSYTASFGNTLLNGIFQYDEDGNFIMSDQTTETTKTITTTGTAAFVMLRCDRNSTSEPIPNCQLELGTTATAYEPYTKHTYPLDSSLTLRGVPKLVDGKLAFDGDVYPPSGEVQRRYGVVDLGTLTWVMRQDVGAGVFSATLTGYKTAVVGTAAPTSVCSKYPFYQFVGAAVGAMSTDKTYSLYYSGGYIYVYDTSYTDAASFKATMSGVYLVYELATPTTETAEGYEQYQICDPSGTEEFVTDSIVPVGHETRYPANLRDKLQHLPDLPSPLIDGAYMVMVSGSQMHLERFLIPDAPTEDGTYTLKATVSGGTPTYTWEVGE